MGMYKIEGKEISLEQVAELLKQKLGDKYPVKIMKATSGAMKYLTGNTTDTIQIKKNGYHGVVIGVVPSTEGMTYSVISSNAYTPSTIVEMITRKAGLLDHLIFKAIWGSGSDFYKSIDNLIMSEYEATEVDTGIINSVKQMVKGKSVFDE